MKKYFILIIFVISLFVSFELISKTNAREDQTARISPTSGGFITLSYTELFIPCKVGYVPTESCPDRTFIHVAVRGNLKPDGTQSEIKYKVSGGRIIGKGNLVKWDFSDVRKAGNYVITVEFTDFENKRQTAFETITLRDCDCPNDQPAEINSSATPSPAAKVERLELDKTEAVIPCSPSVALVSEPDNPCTKETRLINVKTVVNNPNKTALTYLYIVSGGQIVGDGEKVIWDLTGVRPGTYRISSTVSETQGLIGETEAREVEIRDYCCCMSCVCPTVEVFGGGNVKAGESVTFSVEVSGGSDTSDPTYQWTVSQGEIVEGQGTKKITVKTTKEMRGTIEATLEFSAPGLCGNCTRMTASETATIIR